MRGRISAGLMARNGSLIWKGTVQSAKDVGLGYLLVATDSGNYVLHESGALFTHSKVEDAQVISNRFIGLQRNNRWAVFSLAGKALLSFSLLFIWECLSIR